MSNCAGKTLAVRSSTSAEVIDCETCGFAHLKKKPTLEELGKFYSFHFYDKQKPEYLSKMELEKNYWLTFYSWRVTQIENLLKDRKKEGLSILDVGSSGGFFLEAAHRRGWKVEGIEPSTQAADYCRKVFGHQVQESNFSDADVKPASFDAIQCSLVLEHLHSPEEFFKWARSVLKPGGILCVTVPNEFNNFQMIMVEHLKKEPWFVAYPDHLNYFTPASLKRLAERNNYTQVDSICGFPIEMFVLMGDDYIGNDPLGRECHKKRMKFEETMINSGRGELLTDLYRSFGNNRVGRELISFFKI